MKRVVQKLDVVGPGVRWIFIKAVHVTLKRAVSKKAESARDLKGILETTSRDVRLANKSDTSHGPTGKLAFHCCERDGLVATDHLRLLIAGRKGNKDRSNQPHEGSRAQIESGLCMVEFSKSIKGPHACYEERAGHERPHLIVSKLHQSPGVKKVGTETGDAE